MLQVTAVGARPVVEVITLGLLIREVTHHVLPPDLGLEHAVDSTVTSATHLTHMQLALTHRSLDLLLYLLDLLRGHVLLEVMLVEVALVLLVLLLGQQCEHFLRVHATVHGIEQRTLGQHHDLSAGIDALGQIVNHQVDDIVCCSVGTLSVLLPQVNPQPCMAEQDVTRLMDNHTDQLGHGAVVNKCTAIDFVKSIGVRRGHGVIDTGRAHHDEPAEQAQLRVAHDDHMSTFNLLFCLHINHL